MGAKPQQSFDFTRPESCPEWKQRYQRYHRLAKICEEGEAFQLDSLGETEDKILKLLDQDKIEKYEDIVQVFDKYFQPKTNVAHADVKFNSRNQTAEETNEVYIGELNYLIEKFNFGLQNDDQLKYRLLTGMRNKQLSLELQQLSDKYFTLSRVINSMGAKETI